MAAKFIPSLPEIGREALIVLFGSIVAAYVVAQLPPVKKFLLDNLPRSQ